MYCSTCFYVLLQLPGVYFDMPNAGPVAMEAARHLQTAWECRSPEDFRQHMAEFQRMLIQHVVDVGQREAAVAGIEQTIKELEQKLAEVIPVLMRQTLYMFSLKRNNTTLLQFIRAVAMLKACIISLMHICFRRQITCKRSCRCAAYMVVTLDGSSRATSHKIYRI